MKTLLVAESQDGRLQDNWRELYGFSQQLDAATALFLVGSEACLPSFPGTAYLADAQDCGEYAPKTHTRLLLEAVRIEQPDMVVLAHSPYGWDLAPRIAYALNAGQASEVLGLDNGDLLLPACNGKLRRKVRITTPRAVVTLQSGAFPPAVVSAGPTRVEKLACPCQDPVTFLGYAEPAARTVDLSKYEVLVGAGRGVEDSQALEHIAALANLLGGVWGATRPLVSNRRAEPFRQIGVTGQSVAPRLYLACGISGAVQHLAGVRNASLVIAVNTDKDAPIRTLADILVLADAKQLLPLLLQELAKTAEPPAE